MMSGSEIMDNITKNLLNVTLRMQEDTTSYIRAEEGGGAVSVKAPR